MIADQRFSDAVEAAVTRIEARTDVELVVVAAPQSGSYSDLVHLAAAGWALTGLAVLLFNPWFVSTPVAALLDVVFCYGLGWYLMQHPALLYRMAGNERCARQVHMAAAAEFHLEAVHTTPRRLGLLVYVSALERRVELIGDVGLEALVPRGRWAAAAGEFRHDDLPHFLAGLEAIGDTLAEAAPRTDDPRVDLLNSPRIRGAT